VLQNVDVTSLLVGQGDESDIDNPALASILFPTFKQDTGDDNDPNRKRIKQWVRNSALLVVAVRPSRIATFTTRRPFTTCFGVIGIVFMMFTATFWPYMHSLRLDISVDQFRVEVSASALCSLLSALCSLLSALCLFFCYPFASHYCGVLPCLLLHGLVCTEPAPPL
jgi:hypothetical protein